MGAFLDKPKTDKRVEHGAAGDQFSYGMSSMQGWRVDMEDSHTAKIGLPGLKDWSFFAVFDGHAGAKIAQYSSEHLLDYILQHEKIQNFLKSGKNANELVPEDVKVAIRDGFLNLDVKMRNLEESQNGADRSGSTATCVLMSPKHYYFINCGDSRGLLCNNEKITFYTEDHKPGNPLERERIQNAGGSVMIQRVNGSLAVSRALGDYDYKNVEDRSPTEQLVSPDPEISIVDRSPQDQFLVLACDGIFDVSKNDELGDFILSRFRISNDLVNICNVVLDTSLYKGSRDNMTLILVKFPAAPAVCQEAVKHEEEMEAKIKELIKDCVKTWDPKPNESLDTIALLQYLSEHETAIPYLPPGAGLQAKRAFIDKIFADSYKQNPESGDKMG